MYLTNEWYFFTSAIDKKTCNKIKSLGKDAFKPANVDKKQRITDEERKAVKSKAFGEDSSIRISDTSWTSDQWVIDLVWPYMLRANKEAGWNFDIKSVEEMQIAKYKSGGFYGWHKDGRADSLSVYNSPDNKFRHGNGRKLSMSVLLNNGYKGGEFQFCTYSKQENSVDAPDFNSVGSIIVFPSFMEHRVTPVTKGIRYSLVAWFLGPPFK